ncbi:MAG: hypothetical protein NVS4B11_37290 [Ktedonobacteraceae bacterium]
MEHHSGANTLQQCVFLGTQELSTLPHPRNQVDCHTSQCVNGLLMSLFQPMSKMQQGRQRQLDHTRHRSQIVLQTGR